jgi:hypothetical protein
MPRNLPLGNPDGPLAKTSPGLSGRIAIYDPAMCCSTGVCGPSVDPSLLAIARDLRWFETQGVIVERYGLSQEPDAFVRQPKLTGLMHAFGDKALPATLINGEVLAYGRYPSRDEIASALDAYSDPRTASADTEDGCCTPCSGCC